MSFLGSIGGFLGTAAKAVATGGISLIAPKLIPGPINKALDLVTSAQFPTTVKGLVTTAGLAAAPLTFGASAAPAFTTSFLPGIAQPQYQLYGGAKPMGLDVGGILGAVGNLFGGVSAVPALQDFGGVLNAFAPAFSQPGYGSTPYYGGQAMTVANLPARRPSTMLTKEVFDAGVKILTRLGLAFPATPGGFSSVLKRALSSIGSLARRTPAGTIVSILIGLGLTAYESNLLTAWFSQRKKGKRMNPANSKALRRAATRIRRFHKLCRHTDVLRGSRRGGSRARSVCQTCRKNPCRC